MEVQSIIIKVQLYMKQKYCGPSEMHNIALLLLVFVVISFGKCIHVNGF